MLAALDKQPEECFVHLASLGFHIALFALERHDFADLLKRKVEGKLPHLLDETMGFLVAAGARPDAIVDGETHLVLPLAWGSILPAASLAAYMTPARIRQDTTDWVPHSSQKPPRESGSTSVE